MAYPMQFNPLSITIELIFTIISVIFCLLIYYKTKESYDLTKYAGIRYLRIAFLFFGLSYGIRFIFSVMLLSRGIFDIFMPRFVFAYLFIIPLGYFSTVGILYLIFSLIWKRYDNRGMIIIGHSAAALLSLISFITRSHFMLLLLQSLLLIILLILSFTLKKYGKRLTEIRILYIMTFALWLISLWMIGRPRPISIGIEIFFHIISMAVFYLIYHKISKWTR